MKRMFDQAFALCAFAAFSIPILLVAAAVKVTSPGPIICEALAAALSAANN